MRNFALILTTLLAFVYSCASTKFEKIEDPSKKIEKGCVSVMPPQDGNWQVDNSFLSGLSGSKCESEIRLISGGGADVYHVYISGKMHKWRDSINNENWLNKLQNKKMGIENATIVRRDVAVCKNIDDVCVMEYVEYSSHKRLIRFNTGQIQLNPGERYYYQSVIFYIAKGPYKDWIFRKGYFIDYAYTHESTNNKVDPELENKAYNLLNTIEFKYKSKMRKADE